jgi:hypothetical protein
MRKKMRLCFSRLKSSGVSVPAACRKGGFVAHDSAQNKSLGVKICGKGTVDADIAGCHTTDLVNLAEILPPLKD